MHDKTMHRPAGQAWAEAVFDVAIGVEAGPLRSELERILIKVDLVRTVIPHDGPETAVRSAAAHADPLSSTLVILVLDELHAASAAMLADAGLRPVLVVSRPGDVDLARVAGVPSAGILDAEDLTPYAVRDCLERIAIGEVPIPARLAQRLLTSRPADTRRPPRLTAREREVVPLLVEGMSNKQIARRLAISHHGAKRLVGNILAKLDSPNRTFAVTRILREGLHHTTRPPFHGLESAPTMSRTATALREADGRSLYDHRNEMEPE